MKCEPSGILSIGAYENGLRPKDRRTQTGHAEQVLAAKAEAAAAGVGGEQPLDYLLRIMRDPSTEPHRRDAAAKAAAPYLHPQAAIHHRAVDCRGRFFHR